MVLSSMNPEHYEALIAEIARGINSLTPGLENICICSGRTNYMQGLSGYRHQIDVSFFYKESIYIIECKCWKRKLGVQEVLTLAGRAKDIQDSCAQHTVIPVLISIKGASRYASPLAEYFNIKIEIAESAHDFGLKIGNFIHEAKDECLGIGDQAIPIHIRN